MQGSLKEKYYHVEYLEYCLMYKFYIYLVVLSGRLLRTFYNKDCIRCGLFLGSLVAIFKVCIFQINFKHTDISATKKKQIIITTIYWSFKCIYYKQAKI